MRVSTDRIQNLSDCDDFLGKNLGETAIIAKLTLINFSHLSK